ncbi:DUF1972 domain-containing protein [PVC group bacterium]|nr:DUF1972 domain-containing protein [PVC group bacterium]
MAECPVDPRVVRILGTRGIPANHGGFETFAQKLAGHLVSKGWAVTVYCQTDGVGPIIEDNWNGVRLIKVPEPRTDALGTMRYDWKCIRHAAKEEGVVLTLGYNTALFNLWFRLKGIKNIINMDGFEWKRTKWNFLAKIWFYLNDWAGCLIGNHLIADHPEIAKHLVTRRSINSITMIPYGADLVESANVDLVRNFGLEPKQFALCVARIEPENSILEIVRAFSSKDRNQKLVIVGPFNPKTNNYHSKIREVANEQVVFLGTVYDKIITDALRFYCDLYIHGHTVGGTNPTLVESMGAGCAILAHDNPFNRWVLDGRAVFFRTEKGCGEQLDLLMQNQPLENELPKQHQERCKNVFSWPIVLDQYKALLVQITQ